VRQFGPYLSLNKKKRKSLLQYERTEVN